MRRVYRDARWPGGEIVHNLRRPGRRIAGHYDRRSREERRTTSGAGRLLGEARFAVRLLHARHDRHGGAADRPQRRAVTRRHLSRARRQSMSLHRLPAHHRSGAIRGGAESGAVMSNKYVGQRVKRTEDPRLIRGLAHYVDDISLPGTLHVAFVRSIYAHAKINSIDTSAA